MLQASVCDGCTLDAFSLGQDCLGPAEVDVGRGQIVDALMIADVVVVFDEGVNLPFEIACPSSDDLRLVRRFEKGGSGSSGLKFKRPAAGAASGGLRWLHA
jgi:hypothetical protein